jgi:hypothetical protein
MTDVGVVLSVFVLQTHNGVLSSASQIIQVSSTSHLSSHAPFSTHTLQTCCIDTPHRASQHHVVLALSLLPHRHLQQRYDTADIQLIDITTLPRHPTVLNTHLNPTLNPNHSSSPDTPPTPSCPTPTPNPNLNPLAATAPRTCLLHHPNYPALNVRATGAFATPIRRAMTTIMDGAKKQFVDNSDTLRRRDTTSPLRNVRTMVGGGIGKKKGRVVGMYVDGRGGYGVVGGRVGSGIAGERRGWMRWRCVRLWGWGMRGILR